MAYFKIIYGAFNHNLEDYIEAEDLFEANHIAQLAAHGIYDTHTGEYGVPSEPQVAAGLYGKKYGSDEYGDIKDGSTIFEHMTDDEIRETGAAYRLLRELGVSYEAIQVSQEEYDNGGEIDEEEE